MFYKKIFPLVAVANGKFKGDSSKRDGGKVADFLYNVSNRDNLMQPVLHWHKDLSGKTEDNLMDMLEKLSEHQVPIPLKMWLAAAGVDKDTLIRDAKEDDEIRKAINVHPTNESGEASNEGGDEESSVTSASVNSPLHGYRKGVLGREFDQDLFDIGKTGQKKHVLNSVSKQKDINHRIAKIAAKAETDPVYRSTLRRRNLAKGNAIMNGVI